MKIKESLRKIKFLRTVKHWLFPKKLLRDLPFATRMKLSEQLYLQHMQLPLNLQHPMLFSQKIRWYELFYFHPDMPLAVDKYLFKGYIKHKLGEGYTIPLYGMWTNMNDLCKDWDNLPEEFCLKSNLCDSGRNILMIHEKSKLDFESIKKDVTEWLNPFNTLINSYCNAYYNATPRIIAEQYCENVANQLWDYKLFCFDGTPYCLYVATQKEDLSADYGITFYDLEWHKLDIQYG